MSTELYNALIENFSKSLTPEQAPIFRETGSFSYEGINFSLVYSNVLSPDVIYLMCDLGPLGKVDELACYRHMLEVNFLFIYQSGPQMAINPDTGIPVFISRLPLQDLSVELLMLGISGTVQFAQQWKTGEFPSPFSPPNE